MNPALAELIGCHLTAENAQDLPGTLATLHPDCRFEDLASLLHRIGAEPIPALAGLQHRAAA